MFVTAPADYDYRRYHDATGHFMACPHPLLHHYVSRFKEMIAAFHFAAPVLKQHDAY